MNTHSTKECFSFKRHLELPFIDSGQPSTNRNNQNLLNKIFNINPIQLSSGKFGQLV